MSIATIEDGKIALIHYTLTNKGGDVLDSSQGHPPLPYLHGAGNIVPGLEAGLAGLEVGALKTVEVAPADGYGERVGPGAQEVSRDQFPEGADLQVGMGFQAEGGDGEMMMLYISKIEGEVVWVDINHPLAGETLIFEIEVAGVREATDEEVAHGHPHGIDGNEDHGHHHEHEHDENCNHDN